MMSKHEFEENIRQVLYELNGDPSDLNPEIVESGYREGVVRYAMAGNDLAFSAMISTAAVKMLLAGRN